MCVLARLVQVVSALGQRSKGPWFETRIGQWPYFEPHQHQLVRWCQYNVISPSGLICFGVCGRKAITKTKKKMKCVSLPWNPMRLKACATCIVRSPSDVEVCVLHYRDVWLTGWRGDFAYLAQSLAPVPYGIDANGCQCVKTNGNGKWIT
jgi:hypothetical protein